MEIRSKNLKY